MENHNSEIENLLKVKSLYQLKVGNMYVEMTYSENDKNLNECMLNILKQKVGK